MASVAVSQFALVPNADTKSLASFDGGGDISATDGDFDDVLECAHGHSVTCEGFSIGDYFQIGLSHDAIREDGSGFDGGNFFQELFDLEADLFNDFEVGAFDLYSHWCAHAALQHDDSGGDGLKLGGRGGALYLGGFYYFLPDVIG